MRSVLMGLIYTILGAALGISMVAVAGHVRLQDMVNQASECRNVESLQKQLGKPWHVYHPSEPIPDYLSMGRSRQPEEVMMYAYEVRWFPFEYIVARVNAASGAVEDVHLERAWW